MLSSILLGPSNSLPSDNQANFITIGW